MNELTGRPLWDALEQAARRKLNLGDDFEMCGVDIRHGKSRDWRIAKVELGIKLEHKGKTYYVNQYTTTVTKSEVENAHKNITPKAKTLTQGALL